jgi:hypothetical protein
MWFKSERKTTMPLDQLKKIALAAVTVIGLAGPASAYTIDTIPGNSDVLAPGTVGYFGANLILVGGSATITYSFVGSEAAAANSFSFQTSAGIINNTTSPGSVSVTQAAGLLDFLFTTNLIVSPNYVMNGSNLPRGTDSPNFFVSFYGADGVTLGAFDGGTSGVIALDDSGGGNPADADYDDLVIKFTISMLIGFVGLGFLAYRKNASTSLRLA